MNPAFPLPLKEITLAHIAAYADSLEIFLFLELKGASISSFSVASDTPLHYACARGSIEIVSYILNKDPQIIATEQRAKFCYLFVGVSSGSTEILKMLLEAGAQLDTKQFKDNDVIKYCLNTRHYACLEILLNKIQDVSQLGKHDMLSPVMMAITMNTYEAVEPLLNYGISADYVSPTGHETAFSLACSKKVKNIAKVLITRMTKFDSDRTTYFGIVHSICQCGSVSLARFVLNNVEEISVHRVTPDGFTGPHYLLGKPEKKIIAIMELLLNHGFEIDFKYDPNSFTFLGECCYGLCSSDKERPFQVIKWLLDKGADPYTLMPSTRKTLYDTLKEHSKFIVRAKKIRPILEIFDDFFAGQKK